MFIYLFCSYIRIKSWGLGEYEVEVGDRDGWNKGLQITIRSEWMKGEGNCGMEVGKRGAGVEKCEKHNGKGRKRLGS